MNHETDRSSGLFCAALERGDLAALRDVPKADLHTHGFLGGRLARYREWVGCDLPDPPGVFADFSDFDAYILGDLAVPYRDGPIGRVLDFFRFFFAETLREAIADGVVSIEPSIDWSTIECYGGDPVAMTEDFARIIETTLAAAGYPKLDVRPELGMARSTPMEALRARVPGLLATGFFKSIDLYGDERIGGIAEYAHLWRLAGEKGLRRKAHSGELCGADHVRESVMVLGLDAVQHGIAAASDPDLMDFLAKRGTVLNVCPSSNVRLARATSIAEHPVRRLFDAGVAVTVNSDDLMVFDSSVSEEFLKLKNAGLFTAEELDRIRLVAL